MVKTLHFHCRGHGSDPWSEKLRSHLPMRRGQPKNPTAKKKKPQPFITSHAFRDWQSNPAYMGMGSDDVSWTCSCVFHRVEGLLGMADLGWVGSTPHRISSPSRLVWDHSYGEQEEQERADICKTLDMPPLLPHPTGKTVKRQTPDSRVGETDSISWWLIKPTLQSV